MALTKSKLRIPSSLSLFSQRIFKFYSSSTPTSLEEVEEGEADSIEKPQTAATLSPEETEIAAKFHSLIKDHHRKNPNPDPNLAPPSPNFTIPSLSLDFSKISTVHSISPSLVRQSSTDAVGSATAYLSSKPSLSSTGSPPAPISLPPRILTTK
ncbi:hypothetical protein REPUB_Repub19eG0011900 [Reevesia pubescens]